jgi:hypothetical protein
MRVTMHSEPARAGIANEDFTAATPAAAVLLDGAGIPDGMDCGCVHGVAWFARTLGSSLLSAMSAHRSGPLTDLLADSIRQVAALHGGSCDLSHPGSPGSTVVAVRLADGVLDYLVLSDSVLMITRPGVAPQVITDDRLDRAGLPHRPAMDALATGSDEHKAAFRAYVTTVRRLRNSDGGFWVASAGAAAAQHALTGQVPLTTADSVFLLSDGATRMSDLFGLLTWPELAGIVARDGPGELIRRTRTAEAGDPRGVRWPRAKTYDDATVVCLQDLAVAGSV